MRRSSATARPSNLLGQYVLDKGYDLKFAIEPKPNEPRGDILLPTVGHALAFIDTLEHPEHGRPQPRGRARADGRPELRRRHRPGAVRTASCSTSTSTASAGIKYDQDLVFGHGDLHNAFALVDLLENGGPNGGPAYEGMRHFDYKPSRTEDETGVWDSAKANMRTYLLLKERAEAFRADPEVQEALAAAKVAELAVPTLGDGESYADLLADRVRLRGLRRRRLLRRQGLRLRPAAAAGHRAPARRPLGVAMPRVIGVDSSTQSCKVVLRDADTGALIASGRAPHTLPGPRSTRATGGRPCRPRSPRPVASTGWTASASRGQQHGMVVLDAAGRVIRPALLWNDTRSATAADDLVAEVGRRRLRGRGPAWCPVASFTATKLRWLRDAEPENAARVAAVALPHDWLTWRLRGYGPAGESPLGPDLDELVTDRSDASGTAYWSPTTGEYDRDLLVARARPRRDPAARARAGRERCRDPGFLVGPGAGDNAAAALGLGRPARRRGGLARNERDGVRRHRGTGGRPDRDRRRLRRRHRRLPAAGLHPQRRPRPGRDRRPARGGPRRTAQLWRSGAEPGAGGAVLVPYFEGERTPNLPSATATLAGLTLASTTRPNLARAAIEGMLCGLAAGLDAIRALGVADRSDPADRRRSGQPGRPGHRRPGVRGAGGRAAAGGVRRRRCGPAGRLGAHRCPSQLAGRAGGGSAVRPSPRDRRAVRGRRRRLPLTAEGQR